MLFILVSYLSKIAVPLRGYVSLLAALIKGQLFLNLTYLTYVIYCSEEIPYLIFWLVVIMMYTLDIVCMDILN